MSLQLLVVLLVTASTIRAAPPGAPAEDPKSLLSTLSQTVVGVTAVALSQLDNLDYDILSYRINTQTQAELYIRFQQQQVTLQLENVKHLAAQAHKNISSCLTTDEQIREEMIRDFVNIFIAQMHLCLDTFNVQTDRLITSSQYYVDTTISEVGKLEFQLSKCTAGDTACINRVIGDIKTATERLPIQIREEVIKATSSGSALKVYIQICTDTAIGKYVSASEGLFSAIVECVDDL